MDAGLQSPAVDQRTCSSAGLRKTRTTGAEGRAGSRRSPGRRSSRRPTAVCASRRARCIPMHTWGPRAKARCWRAFSRRTSKRSGSAKALASRLAAATETRTRSPWAMAAPPSSMSAVAYRSTIAAAGSSRRDSSIALGSRPGSTATSASSSGCDSRCTIALAIMPSVVSMPPKSMTAALEMTAERSRPPAASASSDEPGPRSSAGPMAAWSSANASRPAAGTSPPAVTSVTAATIASYQPTTAPVSASRSASESVTVAAGRGRPERGGPRARGERPGERAAQLGRARGLDGVDQAVDLGGDHVGEALPDGLQAKRPRERRAVALVLVAVQGEHARADDPTGREARVVDGERLCGAHDVQRDVAAHDQPAVQRGHPRQRRALAQPGEERMSARAGQRLEGDCDLLVVGGGVMGLFTAYHASERVGRVVVLERGRIGDPMTASFGRTRSFRNDYLDPTYARLAYEAFRLWGAFELQTATRALVRCGCLNIAKSSVTPDLAETYAQPIHETLAGIVLRTNSFDRPALRERLGFLDADLGRLDVDAGVVDLPAVTGALMGALAARGVRVLEGVETVSIERDGALLRVGTDGAELSTRSLVVTAGHGTNDVLALLPECRLEVPLARDRPSEAKYLVPPAGARGRFTAGAMPVVAYLDTGIYCHPIVDGLVEAVKIGYYNPPDMPRSNTAIDSVQSFVEQCAPGLRDADVSDVLDVDQCDYDLVADDDFVLGAVPGVANAFVGVGWRGTGYKFAPWVGRVLAELAVQGATVYDIARFDPGRFLTEGRTDGASIVTDPAAASL